MSDSPSLTRRAAKNGGSPKGTITPLWHLAYRTRITPQLVNR